MDTPGLPMAQRTDPLGVERAGVVRVVPVQRARGRTARTRRGFRNSALAQGFAQRIPSVPSDPRSFSLRRCHAFHPNTLSLDDLVPMVPFPSPATRSGFGGARPERRIPQMLRSARTVAQREEIRAVLRAAARLAPGMSSIEHPSRPVEVGQRLARSTFRARFRLWVTHAWPSPAACVWRGVVAGSALLLPRILQEGWA